MLFKPPDVQSNHLRSLASGGEIELSPETLKASTITSYFTYLMQAHSQADDMIDVEPRDACWWVMAKDGALKQSLINGSYKNKTLLLKRKKNLVKLIYNLII
ncbi:unnamed protein product [Rhizophagus irregularis]|nr:unnamed protein product [Rhizophagus irregularis]